MEPKLSVITVCYEAAEEIGRTLRSVLEQRFSDYEYIFVDGGSRDGTVERIRAYEPRLKERCRGVGVISEPDKGIYDAMNKGIARARGEWVLMLNAGDALADPLVLEDLFSGKEYSQDVIYGDAMLRDLYGGKELFKPFPAMELSEMAQGLPFCHQAAFARRSLLQKYPFETRFSVSADYDQFLRAWMDGTEFLHIPRVVALFDCGGICLRRPHATMAQCAEIRKYRDFPGRGPSRLRQLRGMLRGAVKAWAPGLFYSRSRGWRDRLARDSEGRVRIGG